MSLVLAYFIVGLFSSVGLFNYIKHQIKTDEKMREDAERMPEIVLIWCVMAVFFWPLGILMALLWSITQLFKKALLG